MKKVSLYLFFWTTSVSLSPKLLADKVIVKVEDEIILLSELEDSFSAYNDPNSLYKKSIVDVLKTMIDSKILLALAKKKKLQAPKESIDNEVESRMKVMIQNLGSLEDVENHFSKTYIEIKKIIEKVVEEQILLELFKEQILNSIAVSPEKVKQFFEKNYKPIVDDEYSLKYIIVKPLVRNLNIHDKISSHKKNVIEGGKKFLDFDCTDFSLFSSTINLNENLSDEDLTILSEVITLKQNEISDPFVFKRKVYLIKVLSKNFSDLEIKIEGIKSEINLSELKERVINDLSFLKEKINNEEGDIEKIYKDYFFLKNEYSYKIQNVNYKYINLPLNFSLDLNEETKKEGKVYGPYIEEENDDMKIKLIYLEKYSPSHQASMEEDYNVLANEYVNSSLKDKIEEEIKNGYISLNIWIDEKYK